MSHWTLDTSQPSYYILTLRPDYSWIFEISIVKLTLFWYIRRYLQTVYSRCKKRVNELWNNGHFDCDFDFDFVWFQIIDWKPIVTMMPTLSSPVAPVVVIATTSGATIVGIMTTLSFQFFSGLTDMTKSRKTGSCHDANFVVTSDTACCRNILRCHHSRNRRHSWWRHQMEAFSALLVLCAGNSPVTGEFPSQRLVTWSIDVFFDLHLNKRLSKHSWRRWFETPSRSIWRHCNDWYCRFICVFSFSWPFQSHGCDILVSEIGL